MAASLPVRIKGMIGTVSPERIGRLVILALFTVLVLAPAGSVMLIFISALAGGNGVVTAQLALTARSGLLLLKSTTYAAAVSLAALFLGILYALILPQFQRAVSRAMTFLIIALLPLPPYIHALAWNNALSALNTLLSGTSYQPFALQGWVIAWWVQVIALFPFACLIGIVALHAVSRDLVDAARVVAADLRVLGTIVIPISLPFLLAGFGFMFLITLTEYSVPSLFSVDTSALDIFAVFSATGSIAAAFAAAIPLIAVALVVLCASQPGFRALGEFPGWSGNRTYALRDWPVWFFALQCLAFLLLCVQIAVLFVGTAGGIGSLQGAGAAIGSSGSEILYSLGIGVCAIVAGIPLAAGIVACMPQGGKMKTAFWILATLPLALPSSLAGMGLVAWSGHLLPLAGWSGLFLPVLAGIVRFLPVAIIIISAQIHMTDPVLFDAARLAAPPLSAPYLRLILPMIAPGILVAAVFLFSLTLGELGATLLVTPPGQQTLTMKIYNYLHYGSFSAVAGLCALMAGLTTAATACALYCTGRWIRRFRLSPEQDA